MPASAEMTLRVATYNIHRCVGRDGRRRPERIAQVLAGIDADVVALQEVSVASDPAKDVLAHLAAAARARPIEGFTLREAAGRYGNAILSRIDVKRVHRVDLSVPGRERRGLLDIRFDVRGHRVALLATHLGLGPAERRRQVRRILAHLDTVTADTMVVLGDFNEWLHWGRPLRALNFRLGSSPWRPSFPAACPLVAIDRLWVHPVHRLKKCRVHATAPARIASDHLPLVADIDLTAFADTGQGLARFRRLRRLWSQPIDRPYFR